MLGWDIHVLGDTLGKGQQGPAAHIPQHLCRKGEDFSPGFFLHASNLHAWGMDTFPLQAYCHSQGAASLWDEDFSIPEPHHAHPQPQTLCLLRWVLLHQTDLPPLQTWHGCTTILSPSPDSPGLTRSLLPNKLLGRKSTARQPGEQSHHFVLVTEIQPPFTSLGY